VKRLEGEEAGRLKARRAKKRSEYRRIQHTVDRSQNRKEHKEEESLPA